MGITEKDVLKTVLKVPQLEEQLESNTQQLTEHLNNHPSGGNNINQLSSFMHISFDDVQSCFQNLNTKQANYTSLFDEPFFAFLKLMNDTYGAVFSLYCYNISNLTNVPVKYKADFINSSKWLKIGLHARGTGDYSSGTELTGTTDWNDFVTQMYRITGGYNSIDRLPRLHTFAGSKDVCLGMKKANCGAIGFLSADDNRQTYYLNGEQKSYLRTHDKLEDIENGLIFYSTDLRLDWFNPEFTSPNEYNRPIKSTAYEELAYRYNQPNMGDLYNSIIIFTHEWEIYNGTNLNEKKSRVEDCCKFGKEYKYSFDFPQNRVNGGITSLSIAYKNLIDLINSSGGGTNPPINDNPFKNSLWEKGTYSGADNCPPIDGVVGRMRAKDVVNCTKGTFTVKDTTKYNISIYELNSSGNWVNGGTSWSTYHTITSSSCVKIKCAMKKMDGTEFTADEIANANTLYTYTTS